MSNGVIPGLSESLANSWNWITGGSNPPPVAPAPEEEASLPISGDDKENSSVPIAPQEPSKPLRKGVSLEDEHELLRLEAIANWEMLVKKHAQKGQVAYEKMGELNELLKAINTQTDAKGNFEVKDDETRKLIQRAKALGANIPEKTKFTRDERDNLLSNVKMTASKFELEMRLATSDASEVMAQRNQVYQILHTNTKSNKEVSSAVSRGIKGG